MKYFLQFFLLVLISLFASDTYAAHDINESNVPNFPAQIGKYKLIPYDSEDSNSLYYVPSECFTFTSKESLCHDYWIATYQSGSDDLVFVYLSNMTSGYEIKKSQTVATNAKISDKDIYLTKDNSVLWFTGNSKISSFKFNRVGISQAKVNYNSYTYQPYDYMSTSPATSDVYKYFVEFFPPEKLVANSSLVNQINTTPKNISLKFKNIKEKQTFVAGKEYKILLNKKGVASDVEIYFDLSYINKTSGKTTQTNVQISKNKKGQYVWKVPEYFAYGDKKSTDNYIYKMRAGVKRLNGGFLFETQTPYFRVVAK